ncbi:uncharacterized protein LOC134717804 [Mytilus trossulus]|uniref:uncharacterized protein LOC134717804 n=1 Tax=Mytilus trossulus TaxID=6551 RepID=UPI003004ADCC
MTKKYKKEFCTASHGPFGKRRSIGTSICSACCNDKDVCNIDGHCSAEKFVPPTGSNLCYKCHLSGRPDSCHQLTLCDQHTVCSLQQVTNYLGHIRWEHGCVKKAVCSSLSNHGCCSYCCDSPLCNYNCSTTHSVITSPSISSTTTAIQQTLPIVTQTVILPKNIIYGDTVTVQCFVTGNPKPTIDFLFKGSRLGPNVQVDSTTNVLTISNFLPYNDGDYRCIGENFLGDDHKDFHIQGQVPEITTDFDAGQLCLNCKAVPQPLDCTDVVECGTHESCYTQRFITYDGITLFNVGCRDHDQCKANPGRSVGDVNICTRCCNNTDMCNLDQLCSSEAFAPKAGHVLCFSCPYSLVQPTQCHRITLCGQDQVIAN